MQVELGARVQSRDGQDVGRIDKLIIDIERGAASAIILRQGGLFHKEGQVPLSDLRADPAGEVRLTYTADVVHDMLDAIASGSGGYRADSAAGGEVTAMLAQYELTHAVIGAGTAVKGRDGKKVGSVHRMVFEVPSGRLTRLALRRGVLGTEEVDLPASLIGGMGQDEVDLTIPAAAVDTWAALRAGLDVYTNDEVCLGSIVECGADYIQVSGLDGRHPLFVPLASVARMEADRVVLGVDSGHAALWHLPPTTEATTGTAEPPA